VKSNCNKRRSKLKYSVCVLIILMSFYITYSLENAENTVSFSYAFIYQEESDKIKAIDPTVLFTDLKTGDKVKIYLESHTHTHLYLFLLDSRKELFLLFPDNFFMRPATLNFFGTDYSVHTKYFIPSTNSWLVLDNRTGVEEFYLVASKKRLLNLEKSIKEYYALFIKKQKDTIMIKEKQQQVLDELRELRKQYSSFVGFNEKPVSVTGEFRGVSEEMEFTANRVAAQDFYAKTIRIRH
jgi:DNA-directed RNA polymerase subunit H (RpoH/RPB5)